MESTESNYLEDIEALLIKVFNSDHPKSSFITTETILIPQDLCHCQLNQKFSSICTALATFSNPTQVIESLDFLLDTIQRDPHRFLTYLEQFSDRLLARCAA